MITSVARAPLARGPFVLFYPRLHSNVLPDFLGCKSGDSNHFSASGLAGGNGNGTAPHLQKFRQEFDAGLMGTAFHGGEVKETLRASPSSPVIAFFLRTGGILTAKTSFRHSTPGGESRVLSQRKCCLGQQQSSHKSDLRVLQCARFSDACHQSHHEHKHGCIRSNAE